MTDTTSALTIPERLEQVWPLLAADPAGAYPVLRRLSRDSLLDPAAGAALAAAVHARAAAPDEPPLAVGWRLLLQAGHPLQGQAPPEAVLDATREARRAFEQGDLPDATAWVLEVTAFALVRRRGAGDLDAARQALERALALREAGAAGPATALTAFDLSEALLYLGWLRSGPAAAENQDWAGEEFDRGIALGEAHGAESADDDFWARWTLARQLEGRGRWLVGRDLPGDWSRAEADYRRAVGLRRALREARPDAPGPGRELLTVMTHLAALLGRSGADRRPDGLAAYDDCVAMAEAPLVADPGSLDARRDLALALNGLGDLLRVGGLPADLQRAEAAYARALDLREHLLAADPDAAAAQREVRLAYRKRAEIAGLQGDHAAAAAWWRKALDLARAMRRAGTLAAEERWVVGFLWRRLVHARLLSAWRQPRR